jgi:TonB family protein
MHTRTLHTSAVLSAVFATAVISFAIAVPASAATRVTFGALVPAPPIYTIDTTADAGACPIQDSDARVMAIYRPQWLDAVASQSSHASAQIQLDLDSVGNVLGASITNSSGNALLDQQALLSARGSQYAPEVHNCTSFKRSYFLTISFDNAMVAVPAGSGSAGRQPVK